MNVDPGGKMTRRRWEVIIVGVLVAGLLVFELAAFAGIIPTPVIVGTNTVTTTFYSTSTSTISSTGPEVTETNTQFNQPEITLTTAGSTTILTVNTTVTITPTVTTTTTVTAASTLLTPFAMYYTGYTDGGYGTGRFFRSLSPITTTYSDASLSESYTGTNLTMSVTQSGTNGYDLGFYYVIGTLGTLTSGNGLTVTGTGFTTNLWLNPGSWTWSPVSQGEQYVGLGSNGAYGLGSARGTQTINGATTFDSFSGACSGNFTVSQLAAGACSGMSASTPVAIWVGIGPLSGAGSASATVDSLYLS
jgi:hypothetical protein